MFDQQQLAAYLSHVGHLGDTHPDLDTLVSLHQAHLATAPYENLDIQLGRPPSLTPQALFDKVVRQGRGGFCYEMNATLASALQAIGFEVSLAEAGVERLERGDQCWGNHLALLTTVAGKTMLADVGLGDGFVEPLELRVGEHRQGEFTYRLDHVAPGVWRCFPDSHGSVKSVDIRIAPRRLDDFFARCHELSTAPDSSFVKTLTVQQPRRHVKHALRGRTVTITGPQVESGRRRILLQTSTEFAEALRSFGLDPARLGGPQLDQLWRQACRQHDAWASAQPAESLLE